MPARSDREEFSPAATQLLDGVLASIPKLSQASDVNEQLLVGYLAGSLSPEDAAHVESLAANNAGIRRNLAQLISTIESYKRVTYNELVEAAKATDSPVRNEWLKVVGNHIEVITRSLRGIPPTRWTSLETMSQDGPEGLTAFKAVWRALFVSPPQGTSAEGLLRLGFGYRRSRSDLDETSLPSDQMRSFDQVDQGAVTLCTGEVLESGDLVVDATVEGSEDATTVYISYTKNSRTLALAEAEIIDGKARVELLGFGTFMSLPVGPLQVDAISAQMGGWPERSEVGQIIIDSGPRRTPNLGLPIVRNGELEITGYFEEVKAGAKWELSLAVSPNSWQVLSRFDIKRVTERPQVITATLPPTAMDGPFGGALLLKRLG